jgi:PEGA domain
MRKLAMLLLPLAAACATIMHGTNQDVGLSSSPTNARVTVNNKPVGNTPVVAKLSRKDNHIVRFELEGYQPFEATLTRRTSGWVWGNIVFGGLIGLAVDAMSGGLYKLTPEQIAGTMLSATAALTPDGLYIAVVLQAEPEWQKIGELDRK